MKNTMYSIARNHAQRMFTLGRVPKSPVARHEQMDWTRAQIPTVVVRLDDTDPEKAWLAAKEAELQGYFVEQEDSISLLVTGNARRFALFERKLRSRFQAREIVGCRFPQFGALKRVKARPRKLNTTKLSLARPTSAGHIGGWAIVPGSESATVRLRIDQQDVGETCANVFREHLLEAGFGLGMHGFSFRPPNEFLDGRDHVIDVQVVSDHDTKQSISAVLPFHFDLPRPWVGIPAVRHATWGAKDQASYLQARDEIMYADYAAGLELARDLIERKPAAIFKDFGLQEMHLGRGQRMATFKDRLHHRWGILYDAVPCVLGSQCCKSTKLSYNMPGAGSSAEWKREDLLERCPLILRHFASKATTKAYADAIGARTPKDFGVIRSVADFDAFTFPPSYILKPDYASGVGLYLMHGDLNLIDGIRYTRDALRDAIEEFMARRPRAQFIAEEALVQEGVSPDKPIVPLDYKLHAFGGKVRLIHVDDRNTVSRDPLHRRQSWLSRDWIEAPFRMRNREQSNNSICPPQCYDEMLHQADTIAADLGDYVRIDMYATENGPVLGEISTFTHAGIGFTEVGDSILSQAWELFGPIQTST